MNGAKYSGDGPEWRVLRIAGQEVTFGIYSGKSEAINDAFRNNFLDRNLNVISQAVLLKFLKHFLEKKHINPIRPGEGGGSEPRMTKFTAAFQKPLIL